MNNKVEEMKQGFSGSNDYLSGVNDGLYHMRNHLLGKTADSEGKGIVEILLEVFAPDMEFKQFLPPHQIPKGVSDVYEMGDIYTGAVWTEDGQRTGIVSGDWILYGDKGCSVISYRPKTTNS